MLLLGPFTDGETGYPRSGGTETHTQGATCSTTMFSSLWGAVAVCVHTCVCEHVCMCAYKPVYGVNVCVSSYVWVHAHTRIVYSRVHVCIVCVCVLHTTGVA